MEKRCLYREIPPEEKVEQLSQVININKTLSAILLQRGVPDFETAKDFFRPALSHLHDPFLMKDMDKAVERIIRAINNKKEY